MTKGHDKAAADAYADGILNYTVWSNLPEQQNLARAYKAAVAEVKRLIIEKQGAELAFFDADRLACKEQQRAEAAERERDELREALDHAWDVLDKYSTHDNTCHRRHAGECTCGLTGQITDLYFKRKALAGATP